MTVSNRLAPLRLSLRAITAILMMLFASAGTARALNLVHDFYLPLPEAQIRQTFVTLETNVSSTLDSVFSVVVTGQGTVICYDQWEDGYEVNLANPVQSSTQVWGDGNNANGIPPGFTNDVVGLPSGTVLALRNLVPLPRNPSQLLFDARDRLAATKALVVSRAAWATTPGPVLSGAVEVQATIDHGTSYVSPVGQNLTNRFFQYVGFVIMATEDNTAVTIDLDGAGTNAPSGIVLNRGESHLVNGGVRTGGTVNSTKPVQVNLVIGRFGGRYVTDWFTLVPVDQWSSSYYTPVGTSANGYQTFNYFYNPNPTNITINYLTRVSSGSIVVPPGGVTQLQMPQGSGASFNSGGAPFFALAKVGARPGAESAYDWGFTLMPADGLTFEAVVGWGPGSSDGTVNGSPVWVTPVAATRLYVDYNGDRNGPLTDPNGNRYDVHYDMAALESRTVYDPDRDQTAMRLYTVDGTVITAAWGEDPAVAAPGNPYFDFGTTVLPFPVPVLRKTFTLYDDVGLPGLSIGDTLEYTIEIDNRGLLPLGNTLIIDALPTNQLSYVTNTTTWNGNPIPDNVSGTRFPLDDPGYTIPIILRGGTSQFTFRAVTTTAGSITNVVSAVGYSLVASSVAAAGGSASCNLNFANVSGTTVASYPAGTNIYVRLVDSDANTSSGSPQVVSVAVRNLTSGDIETITLTETGNNTGIFQNTAPLPSSVSGGLFQQDGTLSAVPGEVLQVSYTDPIYGDTCSANAVIEVPSFTKWLYLTGTNSPDQGLDRIDPVATADLTTAQSAILGSSGSSNATITVISTNITSVAGSASIVTVSNIPANSSSNRLLLVAFSFNPNGSTGATNVSFGAQNLTRVSTNLSGNFARTEIWSLTNPASISTNVVVRFSAAQDGITVGAVMFSGINQTNPFSATNSASANSGSPSVVIPSAAGNLIFNVAASRSSSSINATGAGQTRIWGVTSTDPAGGASLTPGATSVTNTWSVSGGSAQWSSLAVSIRPATVSVGGGTNVATFTQAPAFCSSFLMPSNSVLRITNYVTVTSGSLPASPTVSATLRFGSTTVAHLTNAAYTAASNWIVWSGTLNSNITVPAGQALALTVSNNQAGAAFRIDYDSATKPSRIALPAGTIINVDSFAVYDAPFPGGNVVTAPTAGSLLYVRATVSDPFGAYDITSLGLVIDGPGTVNDLTNTLNNSSVVASDSCSKTYEFAWQTGALPGGFNLSATANEGTEGISDTATTSLTLNFLDLGTPSTTAFTSGNNGPATNAFAPNTSICVRVNDSDENTNSTAIDFLTATITSSSGDSETLTLAETSTNSGVFTACVTASTSGGAGTNNSTLNAPAGSVLNVTYTDPNDPSDVSSASGTVLTPPGVPGIAVNKTLVTPADGQAGLGESLQFSIQVVNTGSTTLTNVAVTDTFPAANLTFTSASITPNLIGAGTLSWTNLGNFTPGQSVTLTVNFTASAVAASAINSATASGTGTTNSDTAAVSITRSALTITKTILAPTNAPVPIGSNITYRITVLNSGTVAIPTLPLEDTFSAAQLQFVSATVTPDGTGAGSLLWNDITGAGSLAASNSLTIDVTMQVVGSGTPTLNTATADYAVDANGDPVPSASGNVGITTGAARIIGFVYDDPNANGTNDIGEFGLPGVTVELFTDPNADGDPADGTLVRLVTTGAAGDYELLNLTTGRYVVVATDLPGYASSFPLNNRLAFNITNLTTNSGANFFDYLPAITNYATISGAVWSDTNNNAVLNLGEPGLANVTVELIQDVNTNGVADLGEPTVDTVTTDVTGSYNFYSVVPGNYVVKQSDLFGYVSTADSQGANDNQIALLLGNGAISTNNYFLDWFTGNNPGNDAPVAVNDSYSVNEDTLLTVPIGGVLTNDTDLDGDTLSAVLVTSTTNGVLSLNANGSFTYLPGTNFFGTDSFTYRASDGLTNSGLATVTISINSVNDRPSANNLVVTTPEDTATNLVLTASDVDSTNLVFAILSGPSNGSLSGFNTNTGALTYSPSNNYVGGDGFTFTVFDGSLFATGSVTITVTPLNDLPVAFSQSLTNLEDTTLPITLTGSDVDGPVTNFTLVTLPANGSLTGSGANLTYTPTNNYHGPDSFTFTVNDGSLTSSVATISITVLPVNDGPLANNQSVTIPEDTSTNLVLTASDVDSTNLVFAILSGPSNGSLSGFNTNTGALTYSPSNNYVGGDGFTFTVFDGSLLATGSVSITITPINDPPVAINDSLTVSEDSTNSIPVLVNDSDPDGNPITIVSVLSTNGSVSISGTNVVYSPAPNFSGTNTLSYCISDGLLTNCANITVVVLPVNDAPVANNDAYSLNEDTLLTVPVGGVLTNDTDIEGSALTAVLVATTTNGVLTLNANGSFTYLPGTNFFGTDTFTYRTSDGSATSEVATVTLTINAINDVPVANNDAYSTFKNITLNVAVPGVLTNDTDVEGSALTASLVADVLHGTLTLNANGSFSYAPSNNYVGPDSFTYRASDGTTNSAIATVNLTVVNTNTAPAANNDSYSVNEDAVLTVPIGGVLTNDTDVDADVLSAVLVNTTTNGVLSLNANGSFTYTPATNFFGTDTFTYRASDGLTNSGLATVSITINSVNDAPVATNLVITTPEDTSTNLVLIGSDIETTNLVFAILVGPTNGTLGVLNTNTGAVTYSPTADYTGPDSFTFTVFDGSLFATGSVAITVTPLNDPPLAVNDTITVNEDSTNSIPVLVNDTDPDSDPLTIVSVLSTNGSVSISGTNVVYTPATNFSGTNVISYCISDGSATNCANITVVVLPVNDGPIANNLVVTTPEDTATNLVLTASDVDSTNLVFAILSGPSNGSLSGLNTNTGTLTYSPTADYTGPDSFTFTVFDGSLFATGSVTITVTPLNDLPVAFSQSLTNLEDTALSITLTGSDIDGPVTNFTLVTLPAHGALTGSGANLTYTPTNDYHGPDSFTFTVNDGSLTSSVATISITVLPVNDGPLANNQSVTIPEDTATNLVLTASDVDSTNLVFAILVGPTNGALGVLNTNTGAITYSPTADYTGPDSFTFTVFDGSLFATGSVSITVTPLNDLPVAFSQSLTNLEDTVLPITLTGSDVDGPVTNFTLVTLPAHGALTGSGANLTYTPTNDYHGPDSFTFTVNDGSLTSSIATISITVLPVNDAPVANDDAYSTFKNLPLSISAAGVLTNDTDADGESLSAVLVVNVAHGTLSLGTNGGFTYTPSNHYVGPDSFTYRASDGTTNSATATVTITVVNTNTPPIANNDSYSVNEDAVLTVPIGGVLTNDTDIDLDALMAALVTSTTNGVLSLNANGSFTYTPATNFFGSDSFTYRASDLLTNSTVATVTLTVNSVNDAPVATNLVVTTPEDTATNLVLTASDVDSTNLVFAILSGPSNGSLSGFNTNTGALTYSPTADYTGPDSFTFTVFDGSLFATGSVAITVTPINDPPVAINDSLTVSEDSTNSIPVLVNDSDPDGNPITIVSVLSTNGSVSISGTNIVYTPAPDFSGTNTLSYCISDGLLTNCATISVVVLPVNDAPVANSLSITTPEDTATNLVLTASDVDGPVTNFTLVTLPSHGALTGTGANLTYTPTNNYHGPDSFTFTVNDGSLTSSVATISITVLPVNDAPVAVSDSYSTAANIALVVPASGVLTNDTDVEGNSLTATLVTGPLHGSLSLNSDGGFTYTPTNDYVGPDSFTYRANDGGTNSNVATVILDVTPVADLVLLLSGPTNATPSETLVYTVTITNLGPSTASNIFVAKFLPTNMVFLGALAGGTVSNTIVNWPIIPSLPKGAATNLTLTVQVPAAGLLLSIASVGSTTADPDLSNNDGSAIFSRITTLVAEPEFGIRRGTNVFNPQTGLFEQTVVVTNTSPSTVAALRLLVGDFASTNGAPRTNVWLWNAAGTNVDGRRYVQYNSPLNPGQTVALRLEFYNPTRVAFTNSFEVQATLPATFTNLTGGIAIDRSFADLRIPGEPRFVIEWSSIVGRSYTVIYSDDGMVTWRPATPSVTATSTRTQWYDDGPPKTHTQPLTSGSRFYRVILNP